MSKLFELLVLAETEPGCDAMNALAIEVRDEISLFMRDFNHFIANLPANELHTEPFAKFYSSFTHLLREEYVDVDALAELDLDIDADVPDWILEHLPIDTSD